MTKGTYGYIGKRKLTNLAITLVFVVIIGLMVAFAKVWAPKDYRNILLVMAILMVLPGANFLVQLLIILPYKDVEQEEYQHMKEIAGTGIFYTGLHVTGSQIATISLDYAYVHPNGIVCLTSDMKLDLKKSETYIESMLRVGGIDTMVKLYTDRKAFETRVEDLQSKSPIDWENADNKLKKTGENLLAISL